MKNALLWTEVLWVQGVLTLRVTLLGNFCEEVLVPLSRSSWLHAEKACQVQQQNS